MNKKDRLKRIVLYILITLSVIQQMPIIKEVYYGEIRLILYILFAIFGIISITNINNFIEIDLIKFFTLTIAYYLLLSGVTKLLGHNSVNTFELIVPYGILICSLDTNFERNQLNGLLIWYTLLSVILGISSVFYYGEGIKIVETYFLTGKNQIGPILATSALILLIWIFDREQFRAENSHIIFKMLVFVLIFSSMLIIRNRSGILGTIFVGFLFVLKEFRFKWNLRNILFVQLSVIIVFLLFGLGSYGNMVETIRRSIFLSYRVNDLNSVSAGRIIVYKLASKFVTQYPVLGELGGNRFINETPHMYILNKWVKYGVIGSLPIIVFYIYLWFFTIREIFKKIDCFHYHYGFYFCL